MNPLFPKFPVVILEKPHNTTAVEGETVTLSCCISDSNASVTWMRNNVAIQAGIKYDLRKNGTLHQLRIHNLVPEDSGIYICDTGDAQCEVTLIVQGNINMFSVKLEIWTNIGLSNIPSLATHKIFFNSICKFLSSTPPIDVILNKLARCPSVLPKRAQEPGRHRGWRYHPAVWGVKARCSCWVEERRRCPSPW